MINCNIPVAAVPAENLRFLLHLHGNAVFAADLSAVSAAPSAPGIQGTLQNPHFFQFIRMNTEFFQNHPAQSIFLCVKGQPDVGNFKHVCLLLHAGRRAHRSPRPTAD